jgi:hypothetical protein
MNQSDVLIVGLSGKRGSGKDTGAEAMFDILRQLGIHTILRRGYGDALKEECADFVSDRDHGGAHYALRHCMNGAATDEWIDKILEQSWPDGDETELVSYEDALAAMHDRSKKERYRYLMQWWGTEYRRQNFGDDYWLKQLYLWIETQTMNASPEDRTLVYVPDARFPNEAAHVQDVLNGYLVRIERPDAEGANDTHASETSLDSYGKWNARILNTTTLEDFRNNCQRVAFSVMSWKWGNAGPAA